MEHWQRSFRLRLIAGAVLWICAGLAVCGMALHSVIRSHVLAEIEEELEHHGAELADLVTLSPQGQIGLRTDLSDRRFGEVRSGHYWQVERDWQLLRSPSLGTARLSGPGPNTAVGLRETAGPNGPVMLLDRTVQLAGDASEVRVSVAIDTDQVEVLVRQFDRSLSLSLALIAAGLVTAVTAQVTYGLRPLARIRQGLAAIRRGDRDRLPDDLPLEVQPLADSLNAMIQVNDEVVKRARTQAGNLAHALQTPLAILIDEAHRMETAGHDGSAVLREAERMRRQIEYQLANTRAAASRGRPRTAAQVVPAVQSIVAAVSRLAHARHLDFELAAPAGGALVAMEAEDLAELLGNVIENAAKFAQAHVLVTVDQPDPGRIRIDVDDDGPGMPVAARDIVFNVGQRLDEHVPGHGLGLAIVRDIASLYGGSISISDAPMGGARIRIELPISGAA